MATLKSPKPTSDAIKSGTELLTARGRIKSEQLQIMQNTEETYNGWLRKQLSGLDLLDFIIGMDDEDRACIATRDVEAALRKDTTLLSPRDILYDVKVISERIYCTVWRDVTHSNHTSGSLRLVVVTFDPAGNILWAPLKTGLT